jgi:hypothetical protein
MQDQVCAITKVVAHTCHMGPREGAVEMSAVRKIKGGIAALLSILALSACTPPMPPEFKAELAERYVTCVDGSLSVSAPSELTEVAQTWVDGLSESCSGFAGTVVDPATPADVYLGLAGTISPCTVAASSPVGLDAVAVVVTVDGLDGVVFSPALLYKALSGKMTSWADPELQELNPDLTLTDTPVVLRPSVRTSDIAALNEWMSRLDPEGWPGTPSGLVANDILDPALVVTEVENEGTISILPASFALGNSFQTAQIQLESDVVGVNSESIYSAGTQFVATATGSIVTAAIDSSVEPAPAPGSDVAPSPWQGLNQYVISVCSGSNEMVGRSFARYALRLDSQGALPIAGLYEIPESIRIVGVEAVSQGLPEPTIPPSGAPVAEETGEEVVPTDEPSSEVTDEAIVDEEVVVDEATPEPTY